MLLFQYCCHLFVKFLRLALFCDKALTGETLHSVEFLFSLICYALLQLSCLENIFSILEKS